jgi:hypothetical protein
MLTPRNVIFWTIMLCYAASMLACFIALFRGWRAGHLFVGPKSIVYLSPFANIFLGLGFILSGISKIPGPQIRILYIAAGLFQVLPAWKIWKRRQLLKAGSSTSPG